MKLVLQCLSLIFVATLSACSQRNEMASTPADAMLKTAPALAIAPSGAEAAAADKAPPTKRFIALSHQLTVETDGAALQKVFEDAIRRCEAAGCEVLNSSITRGSDYSAPSASLSARMPPQAVDGFLGGLDQGARIVHHQRQAEDKTADVVDAEARIANLTQLRDRLRTMLASRPGNIKDVLEVERELAETQSKLDSMQGVRKALANETEKVAINIQFEARPSISEQAFFAPVISAWHGAGHTLVRSAGNVIEFVAAVLPWLALLIPAMWAMRALWRRRRAAK